MRPLSAIDAWIETPANTTLSHRTYPAHCADDDIVFVTHVLESVDPVSGVAQFLTKSELSETVVVP